MSQVAAIGARAQIAMLALAGARIYPAETDDETRAAWNALPADVAVVVLTEAGARILAADVEGPHAKVPDAKSLDAPLTVVVPRWPG